MVKIAVAGGSGHIAQEIIEVLVATKKHEILILSRRDPPVIENLPGVIWVKTDYGDKTKLTNTLKGVHTVFSFIVAHLDPGSVAQKMLIDASIAAGVKRYAPNEWSGSSIEELPWYAEKGNIREYLKQINKEKKVLEYTLFQPGFIIDYVVPQGSSTKHLVPMEVWIDFFNCRAITIGGKEGTVTLTTMKDLANVVALAIEYDGEWPVTGGVKGTNVTDSKIIEIGAKVRGKPFDITTLREEDVRAGHIQSSWIPKFKDPNLTEQQVDDFSKTILRGTLLSALCGSWIVSDDWNRLLPDYEFTEPEEFLAKYWTAKP